MSLGVGEVILNSIDKDGTGFGYDIEVINNLKKNINCPIVISGGAGNHKHISEALSNEKVDAASTANLFNFI